MLDRVGHFEWIAQTASMMAMTPSVSVPRIDLPDSGNVQKTTHLLVFRPNRSRRLD